MAMLFVGGALTAVVATLPSTVCAAIDDAAPSYSRCCMRDAAAADDHGGHHHHHHRHHHDDDDGDDGDDAPASNKADDVGSGDGTDDGHGHTRAASPDTDARACVGGVVLTVLDDSDDDGGGGGGVVSMRGAPYVDAVCGHHLMLSVDATLWKSNLSAREIAFYEVLTQAANGSNDHDDGEDVAARAWRAYTAVARGLLPFLPRYYGTRRVLDVRAAADDVAAAQLPPPPPPSPLLADDAHITASHGGVTAAAAAVVTVVGDVQAQFARDLRTADEQRRQTMAGASTPSADGGIAHTNVCRRCRRRTDKGNEEKRNDDVDEGSEDTTAEDMTDGGEAVVEWCVHASPLARAVAQRACAACRRRGDDDGGGGGMDNNAAVLYVDMIVMEDVCYGFARPCVLDVKMGSRQYGLHPSPAKKHSKEAKALRSTSARYGIRLAGFRRWDDAAERYEHRGKAELYGLTIDAVRDTLHYFLSPSATSVVGTTAGAVADAWALRRKLCAQLRQLCDVFDTQRCFAVFTSSLLLVYDAADALRTGRVVMVDFAYAYDKAELHDAHDAAALTPLDDGYRHALRSLITLLE